MILVLVTLILLSFCSIIAFNVIRYECDGIEEYITLGFCFSFLFAVISSISLIPYITSYGSYADMKSTYDTVVNQYRESIKMYEDRVVLDVNTESFTDFKYEGYQENISSLIKDLRRQVTRYNKLYIGKEVWSKNILVNWLIKKPDEYMKLLKLEE